MKISTIHTAETRNEAIAAPTGGGGQAFSQLLGQQTHDQERQDYQERIQTLLDELHKRAPSLAQKYNLADFEDYRAKLSLLLEELLQHAYLFQPEHVRDSSGRRKVFATVTVVNQKMKELGEDLLAENREQLNFIGKVDEIRGLLMDLFS